MFKTNREVIAIRSFCTRCKTDVSPDVFALRLTTCGKIRTYFDDRRHVNGSARSEQAT